MIDGGLVMGLVGSLAVPELMCWGLTALVRMVRRML